MSLVLASLLLLTQSPPNQLHFQARLADAAGSPLSGPVAVQVAIYAAPSGGVPLWSETHAASALGGVVTLELGSISALPALFDGSPRYLGLKVGADPEMTPRRPLVSVPFALKSASAHALDATASIPNGLITSAHVLNGTLQSEDIAAGGVSTINIADSSVNALKLTDGAVTFSKIAAGAVTSFAIQPGAVTGAAIAPASVNSGALMLNSVTSQHIIDGQIGTPDLAPNTVTTLLLENGAVTSVKLAASAVTNAKIANGAVDGFKIAPAAIEPVHLAKPLVGDGIGVSGIVRADTTGHSGFGSALVGNTNSTGGGAGVVGRALAISSIGASGVLAESYSVDGNGVFATASGTGNTRGVYAQTFSANGIGVYALATNGSGSTGVLGRSNSGIGVFGDGAVTGVRATASSTSGDGVHGSATATSGAAWGVRGDTSSPTGRGVSGSALSNLGISYGVYGQTFSPAGFGVYSAGNFGGTGAKYFVQPHPNDPAKEIRYVCLEGNESGTYFRGRAKLVGGVAVIEAPEDFALVSDAEGVTAQVTAIGGAAQLWIEEPTRERIVVRGDRDVEFTYFVNGVRRGFAEHRPIVDNSSFVPETRGVPYGAQYPEALRRILVENGTLNADFTPNEATASRMGWTLRAPSAQGGSR